MKEIKPLFKISQVYKGGAPKERRGRSESPRPAPAGAESLKIRTIFKRAMTALMLLAIQLITGKEGMEMMAMFFAQRVILGKTTFDEVPDKLKPGTAEVLIDSGLKELVPKEFGGTMSGESNA